ncbi:hypothetical protein ACQKWADRAFT_119882 [Trichoderma austrokoningii]
MRSLFPMVLGALGLIFVDGVVAQDPPACVSTCANQVRGQFTQYSCTSADDAACLCANANFGFGVRDCGQTGCGATDVQVQSFLAGGFCQGQQLAFSATGAQAPPTSGVSSTPAATAPSDATTAAPTAPATGASIPASLIPPTSTQPTGPPTTAVPASTGAPTSSPPTSTAPPPTTSGVPSGTFPFSNSTTSAAPSTTAPTTSATPTPTSSETAAAAPAGGSGLSQGAAIGIGVGVAGGVVAIAFAAVFMFLRNRNRPDASFDISQPPSNSGPGQGAFEKYSNDIEMMSNRYEDMVPRQQPRVMV